MQNLFFFKCLKISQKLHQVIEEILKFVKTKISKSTDESFFTPIPTSIADVANSKLDEILIILQEISKAVCKKTMSETHVFITSLCCTKSVHYSKRMLRKQDCVKFCGCIA